MKLRDEIIQRFCRSPLRLHFHGNHGIVSFEYELNLFGIILLLEIVENETSFMEDVEDQILMDSPLRMPLQGPLYKGFLRLENRTCLL